MKKESWKIYLPQKSIKKPLLELRAKEKDLIMRINNILIADQKVTRNKIRIRFTIECNLILCKERYLKKEN